ncbi:MAG: hypothetical protein KF726_24510, partial [Anaerolineae bacterium]|nr:hypothetical protein [Anaerolineae bacterium]
MPPFIKGLELCEVFYQEAVKPILNAELPEIPYSAGLIGAGSDVLGFDTGQSTDHDWGPRLLLFLSPADHARYATSINELLRRKLPYTIRDYPTNYAVVPEGQSTWMQATSKGEVNHRVRILTVEQFLKNSYAIDPHHPFTLADWLTTPQQMLLSLTSGRIYHDGLGTLAP